MGLENWKLRFNFITRSLFPWELPRLQYPHAISCKSKAIPN